MPTRLGLALVVLLVALPATAPAGPLTGRTILIDPGHNGQNWAHPGYINHLVPAGGFMKACDTTGTATRSGYTEAAYNWDVARRLRRLLLRLGATVVMTRKSNRGVGPCINVRAAIGNRAHADAAISIHADGNDAPGTRGFHVIYPAWIRGYTDDIYRASYRLARAVRTAFNLGTGMPYSNYIGQSGLDKRSDLGGLNLSNVPKIFVETGNMRNRRDARLLSSSAYRAREAQALVHGLRRFLHR